MNTWDEFLTAATAARSEPAPSVNVVGAVLEQLAVLECPRSKPEPGTLVPGMSLAICAGLSLVAAGIAAVVALRLLLEWYGGAMDVAGPFALLAGM